jgi:hypothetical protein
MQTLSMVDPTAEVACTLPINEADDRLKVLEALVSGRLASAQRDGDKLRICLSRDGDAELDARVTEWAEAEKGCCAFLGFALESDAETVVLDITAPPEAAPTLDAIAWMMRAASRGPL